MIPTMLMVAVMPVVLVAIIMHWVVARRSAERPFGVRVEPGYLVSTEATEVRSGFLRRLWLWTGVALALSLLAMARGYFGLAAFAPLVLVSGVSVAFAKAWKRTMPHAAPASAIRTATLAPEGKRLPGGWPAAVGPFVVLALTGLYLASQWDRIPERFPIHWGFDGKPNGWSTRTPLGVFWPLGLAAGIQMMMLAIAWVSGTDARRTPVAQATRKVLVATAWFIAAVFALVTLTPLLPGPPPVWVILIGTLGFVVYAIRTTSNAEAEATGGDPTPDECWKWGQIYFNPNDPALFVEKRLGLGMTLNFARPVSWVLMVLFVGLPLAVMVFLRR